MKRRNFLIFGSIVGLSPYMKAKEVSTFQKDFQKVEPLIKAVQEHMFPQQSQIPSASTTKAIKFLSQSIVHKSYDNDIRMFVLEGAQELNKREQGTFISMSKIQKEKALRAYEETNYGSAWLSRIMTLTMEAMFSDPIYGSNVDEAGWKALNAFGGQPRPQTRYLNNV